MTEIQIKTLLQNPYNQADWKAFLGQTFADARLLANPEQITGFDANIASQIQKLGYIILNENGIERQIVVYEVRLVQTKLEKNRVGLRNLMRKYWTNIDAAFIVYHSPDSHKWRFSYVSELSGYDPDGERTQIKTEPKRYTYLLGRGETTRTAAERFVSLANKASKATLDDVKDAFSVEKLSKDFFEQYKKSYEGFVEYLTGKRYIKKAGKFEEKQIHDPNYELRQFFDFDEKKARDFCKRMMGRIVFLYFIQKKGWLAVPESKDANDKKIILWGQGDQNFMFNLFANAKYKDSFYSDYLVPLFFKTLNNTESKFTVGSENFHTDFLSSKNNNFPYLNGGLFDNSQDYKYKSLKLPEEIFKNLFDTFANFNFTIYEDSPDEHTVAVDPEMLGQIFENLLEDNKDKGAFYTPKAIVHYMCRESLHNYIYTYTTNQENEVYKEKLKKYNQNYDVSIFSDDERKQLKRALEDVKICDPAIGSGAFPMGLLHEIYNLRIPIEDKNESLAAIKKRIIEKSIYGIDIDAGAVDIARLRFWLSLVVDETEPQPLPNLDFKIVVGNSLVCEFENEIIEVDWNRKHSTSKTDIFVQNVQRLLAEISSKQKQFFNPQNTDKKQLRTNIRNLKLELLINQFRFNKELFLENNIEKANLGFVTLAKDTIYNTERMLKLKNFDKIIDKLEKLKIETDKQLAYFDWKLDFPELLNPNLVIDDTKRGFDIVIGNPPYIQLQKDGGKLAKMFEKSNYKTFERTGDIYALFYEKGIELLKQNGHLCMITSNKWMRAGYGESLRAVLGKQNPVELLDLGPGVFENATVDSNILLIQKNINQLKTMACIAKEKGIALDVQKNRNGIVTKFDTKESWVILNPIEQSIKEKIERLGTPLKDWDIKINYGIKTGYNEAFIIDGAKKDELIKADPKSAEIISPILRGRDIKRYGYEFADLYILFIPWHFPLHKDPTISGAPIKAEQAFENQYPAIYKHLLSYKENLSNRNKAETGIRYEWYALQRWGANYWEDFYKQKIVYSEIVQSPKFYLDNQGEFLPEATSFIMTGENLEYLIKLLHSPFYTFCFKTFYAGGGLGENGIRYKKVFLENLPIPLDEIFIKKILTKDCTEIDEIKAWYNLSIEEMNFIKCLYA